MAHDDFKTTAASLDEVEHGSDRGEKILGATPDGSPHGQWHGLEVRKPWAYLSGRSMLHNS